MASINGSHHKLVGLVQAGQIPSARRTPWLDKVVRRVRRYRPVGSIAREAVAIGLPCFDYVSRECDTAFAEWLRQLAPDVVLIYGMDWLLDASLLSIPALGTLNLHPALLPRYRGPCPTQWAFYHMDLEPGVTVHFVDAGEDTGPILGQRQFRIAPGTTWTTYFRDFVEPASAELLLQALDAIASGTAMPRPQPEESPTPRARRIPPEQYPSLIDWEHWPVERVWHFLRGAPPWVHPVSRIPGASPRREWHIGGYSKGASIVDAGRVARTNAGWRLGCRDGEIQLTPTWRPAAFLKRRLSGASARAHGAVANG